MINKDEFTKAVIVGVVVSMTFLMFIVVVEEQTAKLRPENIKIKTHECDDYFDSRNWTWSIVHDGPNECCMEQAEECYIPKKGLEVITR